MKKTIVLFTALFCYSISVFAQDSTDTESKWSPSISLNFEPVPVYSISGTDTSFVNSMAVGPVFSIRNKNGIGISYSPKFVTGGPTPGIFMHAVTAGVEQYDKQKFDYTFEYSHYFFTKNSSVPYSPLTNEIYTSLTYKKTWLRPSFSAGIGFGKDTENAVNNSAYDIGVSAGVSHPFSWEKNKTSYTISPSVALDAGTNQYFSLLSITKYVGRSKKFTQIVKNSKAASALSRGRRNGSGSSTSSSSSTTTSTTSTSTKEKFNLNNIELGLESSVELGSFTIRPTGNLYLPVGSYAGTGIIGYWQVVLEYNF
ncbi:MAG: hypothetical protein KGO81_07575 [Bacteroidota bacterium]|nr:hypothetical protein [Bacteroidota bacterium]